MNGTRAARTAWGLAFLSVVIAVLVILIPMGSLHHGHLVVRAFLSSSYLAGILPVGLMILGALVVSRQPTNPIGWMFSVVGLAVSLQFVADLYVNISFRDHAHLPGIAYAAWYENLTGGPVVFAGFAFLLLLFPNGRPLSGRWQLVLWLTVIASVATGISYGLQPGHMNNVQHAIRNPFGVHSEIVNVVLSVSFIALLLCVVLSAVSLVARFRRSRGDERQQLKWVALAGIVAALLLSSGPIFWSDAVPAPFDGVLWPLFFFLAVIIIPLSVGIAMLKYRLYDVDLLINRTLVYGSLTVSLAALYLGGVVVLQALARGVTGQSSDLTIAVATLAVAALFNPWRRRVQSFIDRRFYRHKYDATRTLAALSTRLRDEVDLDQMAGDLTAVIQETMQPDSVSLWLRPGGGS